MEINFVCRSAPFVEIDFIKEVIEWHEIKDASGIRGMIICYDANFSLQVSGERLYVYSREKWNGFERHCGSGYKAKPFLRFNLIYN